MDRLEGVRTKLEAQIAELERSVDYERTTRTASEKNRKKAEHDLKLAGERLDEVGSPAGEAS